MGPHARARVEGNAPAPLDRDETEDGGIRGVIPKEPHRAVVVHPDRRGRRGSQAGAKTRPPRSAEARLEEAKGLARAIGLEIADTRIVPVERPSPATFLGSGAVEALGQTIALAGVGLAILDTALTPVQQRNLERAWQCKVLDRTGLILEIFGARARAREGRLQVELAQLTYQRGRLVRSWTHLERQRGGRGFLAGPGETQIESDRRQIAQRMARLKADLERVKKTRALHRQARARVPFPVVALVGYTNAGKSTLFNRLTEAQVVARDRLFATLDPSMRVVALGSGQRAILADTVGFVSDLPTELVAAFRATLEEVVVADLIVHVRDMAHPDCEAQAKDVETVLAAIGVDMTAGRHLLEAENKIDLLAGERRAALRRQAGRGANMVALSAATGEGCKDLLDAIDARISAGRQVRDYRVDLANGRAIAWLYSRGRVLDRRDDDTHALLRVGLDPPDMARFRRLWPEAAE